MYVELIQDYITALRSGQYVQTKGKMRSVENSVVKHCALGVLADLAIKRGLLPGWEENGNIKISDKKYTNLLPPDLAESVGLSLSGARFCGYRTTIENGEEVTHEGDRLYAIIEPFVMKDGTVASIMRMNDGSYTEYTFEDIADVLEEQLIPHVQAREVQGSESQMG
jgi:hypothetical protein